MRISPRPTPRPGAVPGQRQRGFTMVEIAIALGVIGFALVAIIGILPTGLQVQRDNRAETIINQDATFWLDAIRNGARGLDDLTNFVERLEYVDNFDQPSPAPLVSVPIRSSWDIISTLTRPAWTNSQVWASVWAVSGSAAEKEPDPAARAVSFKYRLRLNIEPGWQNSLTFEDQTAQGGPPAAPTHLARLYEIRLAFSYPMVRDNPAPLSEHSLPRSQSYRAVVTRDIMRENTNGVDYYYFVQ